MTVTININLTRSDTVLLQDFLADALKLWRKEPHKFNYFGSDEIEHIQSVVVEMSTVLDRKPSTK